MKFFNIKSRKINELFSSLSSVIISNSLTLITSALVVLVLPKIIGVKEYGYWQLYLFYYSYVGFLHFGWCDGIYLKFGGKKYNDLDYDYFNSQLFVFSIVQIIIGTIIVICGFLFKINSDEKFILSIIGITTFLTNLRFFFMYILQATGRIKESSKIILIDRFSYILLIMFALLVKIENYKILIISDVSARFISLNVSLYFCKELLHIASINWKKVLGEIIENIKIGSNLMFSNIASTLIVGFVRFGIQNKWDIETFGRISLTLSISNLFLTFINSIGIVIFPMLRRLDSSHMSKIYMAIRNILMPFLYSLLLLFFPFRYVLNIWLPNYSSSLEYMGIIFPIIVFEGKMSLMLNTFLKTLRLEKIILRVNIIIMLISLIGTYVLILLSNNLNLVAILIVFLLCLRSVFAEHYLAKVLLFDNNFDIFLEILLTVIFIISIIYLSQIQAMIMYFVLLLMYLGYNYRNLTRAFIFLKDILK